jgi:hypothetical protein
MNNKLLYIFMKLTNEPSFSTQLIVLSRLGRKRRTASLPRLGRVLATHTKTGLPTQTGCRLPILGFNLEGLDSFLPILG